MIKPTPKVRLPHQSILAGVRAPTSFSFRYAHTVPNTPTGTLIQNTARQSTSASRPPTTRPMNDPAIPAMTVTPIANPRRAAGNASVRIAAEFAVSNAPPMPCTMRKMISHIAPLVPVHGHNDNASDAALNTAKPALYMRTRPKMSPRRPNVTTSTAVTTRYPISIQRRKPTLPGCSGSSWMPRKIAGSAIRTIEASREAMNTPRVVFDKTIHL